MKGIFSTTLVAISILLASCSKDANSDTNLPTTGTTTNDSVLLWKYIELDTAYASPSDTASKIIYTYDNLKRLSKAEQYIFNNTGGITQSYTSTFVYNGTDTIPGRFYKKNLITNKTDSTYLTYNSNGFVVKDSTVKGDFSSSPTYVHALVINISILTDSVRNLYLYYNSAGTVFSKDSNTKAQVKNVNTIVQEKVYSSVFLPSVLKLDFAFDNKTNPLYRLSIHYPYYWIDDQVYRAQPYNYTDATVYLGANFRRHLKYAYTYNSNNLPAQATVSNTDPANPPGITKVKYYYTK